MKRAATIACLAALWATATAFGGSASNPLLRGDKLRQIARTSLYDGIPSGWCGRAMYSLLTQSGLGRGLRGGNGQDWEKILSDAGWRPVRVNSPLKAPLGSVLVYMSDVRLGKVARGTPGSYYGHVEMVALAANGSRLYVADMPRERPGGSVPDNFTGRAWVPPGTLLGTPPPMTVQIDTLMGERLKMAVQFFEGRSQQVALETPPASIQLR